jgi:uncharacterized protein (TIRG00374 family)
VSKKLRLAASVVLLAVLAWRTEWSQVRAAFATLRLDLWLLAAGIYAATQAVSVLRWQLLARPLGFREPFGRYLSYYYIGMFFNLVLPTSVGGDVVRAWYLDAKSGRRTEAFVSVIADRVSGVIVLLLIALIALNLRNVDLPAWMSLTVTAMTGGALLTLAVLFFLSKRVDTPYTGRSSLRFQLVKLIRAISDLPAVIMPDRHTFLLTTFLSVVVQLANVLIVWLVGVALHVSVPGSYYFILVPTVTLLTLLPISLNGMGVREGATALLLAPLGVDPGTAMTLAFLWFAAFMLPSLGGVFFYLGAGVPRYREPGPEDRQQPPPVSSVPCPLSPVPCDDGEDGSNGQSLGGDPNQGRAGQPRAFV